MSELQSRFGTTTVVIPTYKRHDEVQCAIRSALAQTLPPLEVIVVNDGPDPEKARLIAAFEDDRVRFHEAPRRGNASATRNFGIRVAKGNWLALLDDDDIWRPEKLASQFTALEHSGFDQAVLAGVEAVFSNDRQLHERPSRPVPMNVPVDQVLFCGYGGAHTSTLMAPRWAFEKYPFHEELERHEDWTWMLHIGAELHLVVAPEVVSQRHLAPGEGLSRPGGFCFSREWYEQNKKLMSSKGRAAFVANILARKAAFDRRLGALPWLVREVASNGGMTVGNVKRLAVPWLIPSRVRQAIKARSV